MGSEEHLKTAYSLAERSRLVERIYPSCWALGKLYLEKGDLAKAEEFLLKGLNSGSRWGWSSATLGVLAELVRVNCLKGELDKARGFFERMRFEAGRLGEKWGYAYESWALGLLASAGKDYAPAAEAFEKSSGLWKELNHPYHHAQTLLDLALALESAGGKAGDRVQEATKILSHLGARLDLTRIERNGKTPR